MKLYVIRHGETNSNVLDIYNGSLLDEIKEKYKNKNILLVTHGGVARAIYFYFNELPKDGQIEKYLPNNSNTEQANKHTCQIIVR